MKKRFLLAGIAAMLMLQSASGQISLQVMDARASGEWIANLFEVRNGKILIATRDLDHLPDIRYKVPEGTEIKPLAGGFAINGVIIDQPGLYPVEINCEHLGRGKYSLCIDAPFIYLADSAPPDLDPTSRIHPKAGSIDVAGFRPIAEVLFAHFSKIIGKQPLIFRTQDAESWPTETYAWVDSGYIVLLSIYQANDHLGLSVTVKRPEGEIEKLAKGKTTKEEPVKGWGAPISQ